MSRKNEFNSLESILWAHPVALFATIQALIGQVAPQSFRELGLSMESLTQVIDSLDTLSSDNVDALKDLTLKIASSDLVLSEHEAYVQALNRLEKRQKKRGSCIKYALFNEHDHLSYSVYSGPGAPAWMKCQGASFDAYEVYRALAKNPQAAEVAVGEKRFLKKLGHLGGICETSAKDFSKEFLGALIEAVVEIPDSYPHESIQDALRMNTNWWDTLEKEPIKDREKGRFLFSKGLSLCERDVGADSGLEFLGNYIEYAAHDSKCLDILAGSAASIRVIFQRRFRGGRGVEGDREPWFCFAPDGHGGVYLPSHPWVDHWLENNPLTLADVAWALGGQPTVQVQHRSSTGATFSPALDRLAEVLQKKMNSDKSAVKKNPEVLRELVQIQNRIEREGVDDNELRSIFEHLDLNQRVQSAIKKGSSRGLRI